MSEWGNKRVRLRRNGVLTAIELKQFSARGSCNSCGSFWRATGMVAVWLADRPLQPCSCWAGGLRCRVRRRFWRPSWPRSSGVHKGGFSKGGFSNNNIIITHKLQNPPFLNPPLWTPEVWALRRRYALKRRAGSLAAAARLPESTEPPAPAAGSIYIYIYIYVHVYVCVCLCVCM